jgi:hypothetical protein
MYCQTGSHLAIHCLFVHCLVCCAVVGLNCSSWIAVRRNGDCEMSCVCFGVSRDSEIVNMTCLGILSITLSLFSTKTFKELRQLNCVTCNEYQAFLTPPADRIRSTCRNVLFCKQTQIDGRCSKC